MKKNELSLFELFQDPLFTMIAIVLMGTVWIILPEKSTSVDTKVLITKDEISSLKNEIGLTEGKIRHLKDEAQKLQEKIKLLEGQKNRPEGTDKEKQEKDVGSLKKQIALLQKDIDSRKKEIEAIEDELQKAKVDLQKARGKDIKTIIDSINRLEKEIEKKRGELSHLEERIRIVKQEIAKKKELEDKQNNLIAQLQDNLKTLLNEIKKLEAEIEKAKGKKETGGGFKSVFESSKKPFYIELVNNCLFPVDEDHYGIEYGYLKMKGGSTVSAVKMAMKLSLQGENIEKIQRSDSTFNKALKKLNPEKERVVFLLHKDSFEIFRKAREITLSKNFEISWWPYEEKEIIITSSTGEGNLPSTDSPKRR